MSRRTPRGLAKFDSASAMMLAAARFLDGKDFSGLGQPRPYRWAVRHADRIPRGLRETIFARAGAGEGVAPDETHWVSTDAIAECAVAQYPQRRYPAVVIGSSSGALIHLAAALGAPWLPQTFLTLFDQAVHPDEPGRAMENGLEPGRRFLATNPGVCFTHMHDPSQDRLMLCHIGYFRGKFRRLAQAYRDLVTRSLEPGGTIFVAECGRRWPTTRLGDRNVFQAGALGGPTVEEYMHGGPRVAEYLARYGSHRRAWEPPKPDGESPEAEWGFKPALRDEISNWRIRGAVASSASASMSPTG